MFQTRIQGRGDHGVVSASQILAIEKLGPGKGFRFKYDDCKGCGLCESKCPCGAIRMVEEA